MPVPKPVIATIFLLFIRPRQITALQKRLQRQRTKLLPLVILSYPRGWMSKITPEVLWCGVMNTAQTIKPIIGKHLTGWSLLI